MNDKKRQNLHLETVEPVDMSPARPGSVRLRFDDVPRTAAPAAPSAPMAQAKPVSQQRAAPAAPQQSASAAQPEPTMPTEPVMPTEPTMPAEPTQPTEPVMRPLPVVPSLSEELDALTANRWQADDADRNDGYVPQSLRDPLAARPRWSSVTLCVVLPILMMLIAMAVWGVAVRTLTGQQYDNLAYESFSGMVSAAVSADSSAFAGFLTTLGGDITLGPVKLSVVAVPDVAFGLAALVVIVLRKRWRLLAQMIGFAAVAIIAAELLKNLLPRQTLDMSSLKTVGNSAPSGHVAVAAVVALALLCVVPRVLRAVVAIIDACYVTLVGVATMADGWHRPADVVMALLLAGAVALLALAFTGGSGMDEPGTRVSSVSVQVVGTVMIVGGLMACGYSAYLIWQLAPGLAYSAKWAASASSVSAVVMIAGVASLVFGLTLAMRHVTASPLSKLGLVGAPPAPPKRR